jgi:hypothetical protein
MVVQEEVLGTTDYVLVLLLPDSCAILVRKGGDANLLPCVSIPQRVRPAQELRKASHDRWGIHVLVLDFLPAKGTSRACAILEVLIAPTESGWKTVLLEQLAPCELTDEQHCTAAQIVSGEGPSPFSRIGWIDEALGWLETATGDTVISKLGIAQYNAGGHFSLIRLHTESGGSYWLKATGEPNTHEMPVTILLSKLCGTYLPKLIATKPAWNAWLMMEEAKSFKETPLDTELHYQRLEHAVISMAELQIGTVGQKTNLLSAGAFDQGVDQLLEHSRALFDYLEQAFSLQTSTKAPRLEKERIRKVREIFADVCHHLLDLDLPETIVHGDLNSGNILTGAGCCQFIDWSEAYVGSPLISLQHLLLLDRTEDSQRGSLFDHPLWNRYRTSWLTVCSPSTLDAALPCTPLLAVVSSLFGRGDWLHSARRDSAHHQKYARNLARHMDRAAGSPELLEVLKRRFFPVSAPSRIRAHTVVDPRRSP